MSLLKMKTLVRHQGILNDSQPVLKVQRQGSTVSISSCKANCQKHARETFEKRMDELENIDRHHQIMERISHKEN